MLEHGRPWFAGPFRLGTLLTKPANLWAYILGHCVIVIVFREHAYFAEIRWKQKFWSGLVYSYTREFCWIHDHDIAGASDLLEYSEYSGVHG